MAHYWTADDPIETRREQLIDWIEDLVEFGPATAVEACREWRRSETRRPMPADIRQICIELKRQQHERIALAAPADMDEYARSVGWDSEAERRAAIERDGRRKRRRDEELAEAHDIEDQWARDHGYADYADYEAREGIDHVDACCNIARSFLAAGAAKGKAAFADPPELDRQAALKAMGVTARPEQVYTPEEMRKARIALGLEAPEPEPIAAE